jgi:prepilin-type N-terminal cleavage/methylation domain-containing protein
MIGADFMKCKNDVGMTLLEIILSLAIIGIIAISFLPLFTSGFIWVKNAGNETKAAFVAQQSMEKRLSGQIVTETEILNNPKQSNIIISVTFNGMSKVVTSKGDLETIEYDDGKSYVKFVSFFPY